MEITPLSLGRFFQNLDLRFRMALQGTTSFVDKYAMTVPSNSRATHYPILERVPAFREWIDERVVNNASLYDYVITNKDFEDTLEVARNDLADDQYGIYGSLAEMLGQAAKIWPDQLVTAAIEQGNTALAYDQQPFFNANHPVARSNRVISNLLSSATSGPMPLNASNLQSAMTAINGWRGSDGAPFDGGVATRLTLMIPTNMKWLAHTLLNATFIAPAAATGGNAAGVVQSNVLTGAADIVENPFLTSPTAWYLLKLSAPLKPFIFQQRQAPKFVQLDQEHDENVFWRKKYVYGGDSRGNAGFGPWFLAAKFDV